jgi:hopanoid-associated phosphorylase
MVRGIFQCPPPPGRKRVGLFWGWEVAVCDRRDVRARRILDMSTVCPIIAVTCLSFEARVAAGPGVLVFFGNAKQQAGKIRAAVQGGARGIISIGIAGGLDPGLAPGDWVVGSAVVAERQRHSTDRGWAERLLTALPGAAFADIVGVDAPVTDPLSKAALRKACGAAAVDMESHIAAEVAKAEHVPFAACRVIIDPAQRTVPAGALSALRLDGTPDIAAMIRSLIARPSDLPAFFRILADARKAASALIRGRKKIGSDLGFPDTEHDWAPHDVASTVPATP